MSVIERIYQELADAIDLLDNTTAAEGSEDSLGQAELALLRARELLIPRIEGYAMSENNDR